METDITNTTINNSNIANINKLKAEVYDIIRQQEQLANQNNALQDKKIMLSLEIQTLEAQLSKK